MVSYRSIESANQILNEIDEDEFPYLTSKERFGIAHKPLSNINIISFSHLHGYLLFWVVYAASMPYTGGSEYCHRLHQKFASQWNLYAVFSGIR